MRTNRAPLAGIGGVICSCSDEGIMPQRASGKSPQALESMIPQITKKDMVDEEGLMLNEDKGRALFLEGNP